MTDMIKSNDAALRAFEPNGIEEAYKMAKILIASRMMPRHLTTPEAVFAVIATGRELGLTALQSTRSIYYVDGKVTLSADLIVSLVKRHPQCEYFRLVEVTADRCVMEAKRTGEPPTRMEWTMKDAANAGLAGKDNWKKYPKAMLRARVSTDLARAVFPDAAMGIYDPDELNAPVEVKRIEEAPVTIDVAPAVAPEPPPSEQVIEATDEPSQVDPAAECARMISQARNESDLAEIATVIKSLKFSDEAKKPLMAAFKAKKASFAEA